MLQLQNYNLNVVYKPGPEMYISDMLSRAALNKQVPNEPGHLQHAESTVDSSETVFSFIDQALHLNVTDASLRKIVNETKADNALHKLAEIMMSGWPECKEDVSLSVHEYWPFGDKLNIQNGVLFRGQCVIIPKALRAEMLTCIPANYIGGEARYRQVKETLAWPNMRGEIKYYVANCAACNKYMHKQQKEMMMSLEIPVRPWQIVSMDLYAYGGREFLIIVDHYSDYWKLISCRILQQTQLLHSVKFNLHITGSQISVVEGVSDKIKWKRRMTKFHYNARGKDLPELNVGKHIRMKPLPGDHTGRWKRGQCLGKVNPRSYVVNVDGTIYRHNRVDLRKGKCSDQFNHQEEGIKDGTSDITECEPEHIQEKRQSALRPCGSWRRIQDYNRIEEICLFSHTGSKHSKH
ncbi:hypothetical protein QQF64_018533 [Cirrhinus molitorella]|uniref:Gypsy retrotransposon integrase-like protein 1 n=1 Tax=Cirrhinus molitorella TaxID=172907 RepID=A0ABR3LGD0_9TELE